MLPNPSDGIGVTWLTNLTSRIPVIAYRPDQLFQTLIWVVGTIFFLAFFVGFALDRDLLRRLKGRRSNDKR